MKFVWERARGLMGRLLQSKASHHCPPGLPGGAPSVPSTPSVPPDPATIPDVATLLVSDDRDAVQAAAEIGTALLAEWRPEDLHQLDERMRAWWVGGTPWRSMSPAGLANRAEAGESGPLLLQLASMHASGFVREEAVKRLSLLADGSELPYLLLRLTDWVTPVRQAAQQAMRERLREEYVGHFVRNLALVVRLQQVQRDRPGETLAEIERLLTTPPARKAMIAAMNDHSRKVRRGAFHMLVSAEGDGVEAVLLAALRAVDPVLRLWSLRMAAAHLDREQLEAVLRRLSGDPAPSVRAEALAVLDTQFPEQSEQALMAALLASSTTVRAQARFHLRQRGVSDFAQAYRNATAADLPRRLAAAIAGLAETGVRADAERIAPFLTHESAAVRGMAIRGLMKLAGDEYAGAALNCVLDGSPGVSRQAMRLLKPHAANVGVDALWRLFEQARPAHVRRNLLVLLSALPKWDRISCLLHATGDADEIVAAQARANVRLWNDNYNLRQTTPSRAQLARLQEALTHAGEKLAETEVASIRFAIRAFSSH